MKLRAPPRYGAISMHRLIASVCAGEPVQQGDAQLTGPHGRRDARLTRYAGAQHRTITPEELHNAPRQDSPPDAQQPPAEPEAHPGGS